MRENGCTDLQADVHTEDKNDFGVNEEDGYEEVDVIIYLESVRGGIAGGLNVIGVVKLDAVVDGSSVGERCRIRCRKELMADEDVPAVKKAANKDRQDSLCVRARKDIKDTVARVQKLADGKLKLSNKTFHLFRTRVKLVCNNEFHDLAYT